MLARAKALFGADASEILATDPESIMLATAWLAVDVLGDQLDGRGDGGLLAPELIGVSEAFDDWLRERRAGVERRVVHGLLDTASRSEADGLIQDAINALEGALDIEPFREDLLRRIMALLADAGRGAEALQRFDIFATYLDVALGVPPGDETAKLREDLLAWRPQPLGGTPRSRRADRPSVIVLPFDNLTGEAWLTPLGRMMAEDMV